MWEKCAKLSIQDDKILQRPKILNDYISKTTFVWKIKPLNGLWRIASNVR